MQIFVSEGCAGGGALLDGVTMIVAMLAIVVVIGGIDGVVCVNVVGVGGWATVVRLITDSGRIMHNARCREVNLWPNTGSPSLYYRF